MGEPAIAVRGLRKSFGAKEAVAGIDLDIAAGSFAGLVGPNGAGKTTSLSMMTGLLRPDIGQVLVTGLDVWADPPAAKAVIGVVPDEARLFDRLSGEELLEYAGRLRGLPIGEARSRAAQLLDALSGQRPRRFAPLGLRGRMKPLCQRSAGVGHPRPGGRTREVTLDPGDLCGHSGQKTGGQAGACPDRRRTIPCTVQAAKGQVLDAAETLDRASWEPLSEDLAARPAWGVASLSFPAGPFETWVAGLGGTFMRGQKVSAGRCWPCAEGAGINGNRRRSPPSVRPVLRGVERHGQWRCWADAGDLVSYLRRHDHAPDRWP